MCCVHCLGGKRRYRKEREGLTEINTNKERREREGERKILTERKERLRGPDGGNDKGRKEKRRGGPEGRERGKDLREKRKILIEGTGIVGSNRKYEERKKIIKVWKRVLSQLKQRIL